ncbi:MAG TPA: PKD domain-containing protein, partial [Thermoanaerobaculia bacterium]|nr:PKD domain-containing protein [Thermoanaerobaculia bacterium]
ILFAVALSADCVSDTRLISTRESVPNLVAGPVAWSGTVLGVAKVQADNRNALWFGVYGHDLETLSADRLIATDAIRVDALLWNGSEFGLFYRTTNRTFLQRISTTGEPIGDRTQLNVTRTSRIGDEVELAWSAALNAWVIARHIDSGVSRGIWVTIVERDGTDRRDVRIPVAPAFTSELALSVTESGIVGVFMISADDERLWMSTVEENRFPLATSIAPPGTHVLATSIDNLFVVSRLTGAEATSQIRWFVADTAHQVVRADAALVPANGAPMTPLSLIAANGELALTYIDGEGFFRLRRFTATGVVISDARFAATSPTASRAFTDYPMVWTGSSYITSAVRQLSNRLDSYLIRYCPLTVAIVAPRVVRPGERVTIAADVSGGAAPYEYQWTISREPGTSRTSSLQRTFASTGARLVTLTVTDSSGVQVTSTFTIEVVDTPPPPAPSPRRRAVRH